MLEIRPPLSPSPSNRIESAEGIRAYELSRFYVRLPSLFSISLCYRSDSDCCRCNPALLNVDTATNTGTVIFL